MNGDEGSLVVEPGCSGGTGSGAVGGRERWNRGLVFPLVGDGPRSHPRGAATGWSGNLAIVTGVMAAANPVALVSDRLVRVCLLSRRHQSLGFMRIVRIVTSPLVITVLIGEFGPPGDSTGPRGAIPRRSRRQGLPEPMMMLDEFLRIGGHRPRRFGGTCRRARVGPRRRSWGVSSTSSGSSSPTWLVVVTIALLPLIRDRFHSLHPILDHIALSAAIGTLLDPSRHGAEGPSEDLLQCAILLVCSDGRFPDETGARGECVETTAASALSSGGQAEAAAPGTAAATIGEVGGLPGSAEDGLLIQTDGQEDGAMGDLDDGPVEFDVLTERETVPQRGDQPSFRMLVGAT